jgi:uncharacterized protein (TIGR02444 family)
MSDVPSAFWDFSIGFYAQAGVAAACLELQDQAGADINVLLYLFFMASRSRQLDGAEVALLDTAVSTWRDQVVQPLRAVRRHMKSVAPQFDREATSRLREEIKRSELAAERIEQHTIERLFPPSTFGHNAASCDAAIRASIAAYAGHLGSLPAAATDRLIHLFAKQ